MYFHNFLRISTLLLIMTPFVVKASQDLPTLTLGGKLSVFLLANNQKTHSHLNPRITGAQKGEIIANIRGNTLGGVSYGGVVAMQAERSGAKDEPIKAAYAYISHEDWGNFQAGDVESANSQLMLGGVDVMGGSGGFDGAMWKVINHTSGVLTQFSSIGSSGHATKFNYTTPSFEGLRLGVSYVPHNRLLGSLKIGQNLKKVKELYNKGPSVRDQLDAVVAYRFGQDDWSLSLAAMGSIGRVEASTDHPSDKLHDLKAYQLGLLFAYKNWQFGAGYLNNQRSMQIKTEPTDSGQSFNVALGYKFSKIPALTVALGYMGSRRKVTGGDAKADVGSLTVDYRITKGLTVFGETNIFKTRAPQAHFNHIKSINDSSTINENYTYDYPFTNVEPGGLNRNNRGAVFVLGTRIRF